VITSPVTGLYSYLLGQSDMRLEATSGDDQYKVWMTDDDLYQLRRAAVSYRDDVMLQLGGFVGLQLL